MLEESLFTGEICHLNYEPKAGERGSFFTDLPCPSKPTRIQNSTHKKAIAPIIILGKIDFKTRKATRSKEGHFIIIIGPINQEDTIIINKYAT